MALLVVGKTRLHIHTTMLAEATVIRDTTVAVVSITRVQAIIILAAVEVPVGLVAMPQSTAVQEAVTAGWEPTSLRFWDKALAPHIWVAAAEAEPTMQVMLVVMAALVAVAVAGDLLEVL